MRGIFLISLLVLSSLMNRGNTDMTTEMSRATMPLLCLSVNGREYNEMQPFTEEMDICRMDAHITPIGDDRTLHFAFDLYGNSISKLSVCVRSLLDGRLIEETQIFDYANAGDRLSGNVTLRDLIKEKIPYSLCVLAQCEDGRLLRYYTRIVRLPENTLEEMLDFALYFHECTFDKVRAHGELPTWLESNRKGDNSTFTRVDIHSSADQVSWGSLNPQKVTKPRAVIRDIDGNTAQICLDYLISVKEGEQEQYCFVHEFYRCRRGRERMLLLEYERTMEELFDEERAVIAGNKIQLGMVASLEKKESNDGHILAFANCGRLYSYDATTNRLAYVFGFYDQDMEDRRETARNNNIRIFDVDETGDVSFCVWGYMNCGNHEGSMGVILYHYNRTLNTVEEKVFVPFYGSYEQLKQDVERLCYADENNMYLCMDNDVYRISVESRNTAKLSGDLPPDALVTSESQLIAAWGDGTDIYDSDTINVYDLGGRRKGSILSEGSEKLLPITFFGEDLVYGKARDEDITTDESGHTVFPMYSISIRGRNGKTLKEYSNDGIFVTAVEKSENMITLKRVQKSDEGKLVEIADDQILNNGEQKIERNTLETVVTERFETITQLKLRSEINTESLQILNPRFVLFEGKREIHKEEEQKEQRVYDVIMQGKLYARLSESYKAIEKAFEGGGAVRDERGVLLYRRTALLTKNQIMAIRGPVGEVGEDKQEVLAACLNTWLSYEGVEYDSLARLSRGVTAGGILAEAMPDAEILDLSGLPLDAILYYVANERPVLVQENDGGGLLLVGYNELNVVVMDPTKKEAVYKIGREDAAKRFGESGNRFLTCLRPED